VQIDQVIPALLKTEPGVSARDLGIANANGVLNAAPQLDSLVAQLEPGPLESPAMMRRSRRIILEGD